MLINIIWRLAAIVFTSHYILSISIAINNNTVKLVWIAIITLYIVHAFTNIIILYKIMKYNSGNYFKIRVGKILFCLELVCPFGIILITLILVINIFTDAQFFGLTA